MSEPRTRLDLPNRAEQSTWSAFVGGDCVYKHDSAEPPISAPLVDRIGAADVSIVNLEAPVRTDAEPIDKSGPAKETSTATPRMLRNAGFDCVTLANNHTMDYGASALAATIDACHDADLRTCGAGEDADEALAPLLLSVGDRSLAVFSVCEREFGIADDDAPGTAWIGHRSLPGRIERAAETHDAVIVAAHGGIEHVPFSPPERRDRLRQLVDAGADAVIGHHPHVPQGWEIHDGAPVFHSLGNFHFEMSNPNAAWGYGVELRFAGDDLVAAELVPTEFDDGVVYELGRRRDRGAHLDYLHRLSEILADPERFKAHWQEVAVRTFLARHGHSLRKSTGGTLLSFVRDPLAYVRQDAMWDPDDRRTELLVLLNLTRNESLQATIRTALEVRSGEGRDLRTPESREETRELLSWATEGSMYDRPHRARELLGALAAKLAP